jgi:hypothetical protein
MSCCGVWNNAADVRQVRCWPRASILACLLLRRCWGLSGHDEFKGATFISVASGASFAFERPAIFLGPPPAAVSVLLRGKRRLSDVDVERARLLHHTPYTKAVPMPSVLPIFNMPCRPYGGAGCALQ